MQIISNKRMDALTGTIDTLASTVKSLQSQAMAASFNNFNTQIFPTWQVFKDMKVYEIMDDVYSVIRKLVVNSAMIPFCAYDKQGKDLPDSDKLSKFLTTLDFEEKEKLYTFLYLTGEVFAYKNKLDEGVNAGLNSLMFLNPARMVVILSQGFPSEIVGYRYYDSINGYSADIGVEDMIYIKFFNPTTDHLREFRGLAPVTALSQRLTRVQAGMDTSVAQMQNGGVPGIVYDKSPALEPTAMGLRKDSFGRYSRNSENKGAPYFASGEMGYIPLGLALADLDVAELASIDFNKVCNAFGVSSILFNAKDASTESNVQEMVKEMYTNTIIPNVCRVTGALNKGAVPDIKTSGTIKEDISDIKALHDDATKQAAALAQRWWLTGNEKRQEDSYDVSDDPLMDKFIVPSGMMLLDDLDAIVPPVDNTAGDYDAAPVVPLKQSNG